MTGQDRTRARLEARMAELRTRTQEIEAELDSHADPDWDDMALAREGDEVLEGLGMSAQHEVRLIRAALDRLTAGTYGTCASCGAPIGAARLSALPYTPVCRDCAA